MAALLLVLPGAGCASRSPDRTPPAAQPRTGAPPVSRQPRASTGRTQEGIASWYGRRFHGRRTASGERYDMHQLTAAHPSLPFGTRVRVINLETGREVVVRVNDRGPFVRGRIIDLSYAAARAVGMVQAGLARVRVEVIH